MAAIITGESLREETLPPAARGVENHVLDKFIGEAERRVKRILGLSLSVDLDPEDEELYGIIRDLASARAQMKMYGQEANGSDQGFNTAIALRDDALARLREYDTLDSQSGESTAEFAEDAVYNVEEAMWTHEDFDFGSGRRCAW